MPSQADPIPGLPERDVGAECVDASGNLVAGHARILNAGPVSLFHQRIAVADAAGLNFNAHLPAAGLRNGTLDDFKISTGLADLDGFHGRPLSLSGL